MKELTDEELVATYLAGQRDAFNELEERHRSKLKYLCSEFGAKGSDVKDAVQNTWLEVLEKLPTFKGPSFKNWLYKIARNQLIDEHRTENRQKRGGDDGESLDLQDMEVDVEDELVEQPDECMIHCELREHMDGVIEQLPADQQHVLRGLYYDEKTYDELSAEMGVETEQLYRVKQKALRKLRKLLGKSCDDALTP